MPNLGRWLNRDPLQEAGGINLYAYVNGDPMGYVDPDGRYTSKPYNPSRTDHLVYPPQRNSQCFYDCYNKTKKFDHNEKSLPEKSSKKGQSCSGEKFEKSTKRNIQKNTVQEILKELYIEVSCDVKCSL